MNKKRAVFLDRDDTLIKNVPYAGDPDKVMLLPKVREFLPKLKEAGFELFLVSNQSGVGRGLITPEQVASMNEEMIRQLGLEQNFFTAQYMCYLAPWQEDPHQERKPGAGLLFKARDEYGIDLAASVFVGDRMTDMQCGINAGCKSVLLLHDTEDSENQREKARQLASFVAEDFAEAVKWILNLV